MRESVPDPASAAVGSHGDMPVSEEERLARNEATFRRINEQIEQGRRERDGRVGFVCECGELGCNEVVELELADYEAVRGDARCFVVSPGHQSPFDEVVRTEDGYAVVAKATARSAAIAEETDPRLDPR